ncbi:LPXTG cell wall anchor domain-containing protein [Ligilactobacillus aviarius]|uniref:LPXTG cell wall anchor domain-containing protein n=1 Tax=Ligilactobacillus aviarius TaxID=1606 RepID=UPI0015E05C23|nr:LPXTG cell wall anchor domain-containing protein [Ligilactobacillus aviarius]
MSVVNAISVQSLSSSAAKVSSTKGSSAKSSLNLANSSSNSVNVQVASSSHSQAVPSQNNSVAKSQSSEMAQSSVENASSASSMSSIAVNTNQRVQPVLASSTDSTASGSGKIGETNIKTLTSASTGALYPHFQTSNGDVVYCYNWDLSTPDQIAGNKYNQYKFFDGLQSVTGNQTKVDEVAAALEAGYHKDADSNTYNVAPQFQNIAEQSYNAIKNDPKVASLNNVQNGQYTLQDFEQDVTQSVIWTLGGATSDTLAGSLPDNYLAENTALGKALLAYAKAHPLDQNTAYPKNVAVKDSNGTVNDSNPLVMDPTTKLSQPFQLSNYNGGVSISNLPKGYKIVDKNGKVVNQVQGGQSYRVKYVGSGNPSNTTANNTVNKIQAKASYEALKDSNYFSAQLTNNSSENNPYQNMVNLTTTENSFDFPIVWSSISSSSSVSSASSKESSESSISSVSSVKSSSVVSSSKKSSSSAKSSSKKVASSSKKSSSSAKSSSVVASKKATTKSSSVVASKKATTKSSSAVASKKATAKNSSSANTEKATTSTTEGSSSAKKAVVVGVHNNTNSGKGTGHGQGQGKGEGEGHGMPQTGEAVATSLVVAGVVLLATAGAITLRKRN